MNTAPLKGSDSHNIAYKLGNRATRRQIMKPHTHDRSKQYHLDSRAVYFELFVRPSLKTRTRKAPSKVKKAKIAFDKTAYHTEQAVRAGLCSITGHKLIKSNADGPKWCTQCRTMV